MEFGSIPYMAVQMDAGYNLSLWLQGKKHDTYTSRREYSRSSSGRYDQSAPFTELHAYCHEKTEEWSNLFKNFPPTFLLGPAGGIDHFDQQSPW